MTAEGVLQRLPSGMRQDAAWLKKVQESDAFHGVFAWPLRKHCRRLLVIQLTHAGCHVNRVSLCCIHAHATGAYRSHTGKDSDSAQCRKTAVWVQHAS